MDNRIMKLIIALGKFSAQPRQYRIIEGLNASETGVFWFVFWPTSQMS